MRRAAGDLAGRLLERIRRDGPITFAAFMEAVLYDPAEGFYARPALGPEGHFVTSPHVSPAFGGLVARQLGEAWDFLGRPDPFPVIEAGAGDGTLARAVLEAAALVPKFARAVRYVAVERSPGARRALEARGIEARASVAEAGRGLPGCVLANELLDNMPFHRLRERKGRAVEVFVATEGGRLVEVEGEPSAEALAALRAPLAPGEERPVSPSTLAFVGEVAATLARGYAFLFDYGFGAGERPLPLRAYRRHRLLADVLEEPGSRDVTAGVDFAAIMEEAALVGLSVWGPVSQREALRALGFADWAASLDARRAEAEAKAEQRAALRLRAELSRASILVDPEHLGSLRLLVLGKGGLPPPAAVRALA